MKALEFNGKAVATRGLEFGQFDYRDESPWLERAYYEDGTPLTDSEMDDLADAMPCELHEIFMEQLY
jgi:hypothetical protein